MSTFDAEDYAEAVSVPIIKINNKPVKGVILSFEQYMPYLTRFVEFKPDEIEKMGELEAIKFMVEYQKLKADFFRALFPKKFKYHFTIDPVDYLLRLSHVAQEEAFTNFFFSAGAAHGLKLGKKN